MSADSVITAVETIPLRIPWRPGATPGAKLWGDPLTAAESLLVRVTTSDGLHGWGEAFGYTAAAVTRAAVEELVAPLCVGRDATAINALMTALAHKFHVFGRGGPLTYAMSAVDIALWDIAGKRAGVPVSALLGGAVASELRCHASLACYADPGALREVVGHVLDLGFGVVKLHEATLPVIAAAGAEAGAGVEFIVDTGCPWSLESAAAQAAALADAVTLLAVEEPLWPPENFAGLAELRRRTGVPVAAGENVGTLLEFGRLLDAHAVDFVQPSPAKLGGLSELVKVFPLAAVHNVPVLTHSFYDGPGLLAAIHATAALGTPDSLIEWRWFDLTAGVYGDALAPLGGRVKVPTGPGLGLDPDPDVLAAYRTDG